MTQPLSAPTRRRRTAALVLCWVSVAIIPLNLFLYAKRAVEPGPGDALFRAFVVLAWLQVATGATGCLLYLWEAWAARSGRWVALLMAVLGALSGFGGIVGLILGVAFKHGVTTGGAWGRPLRLRGRQVHPELCEGSDWAQGDAPDASALDAATRQALEGLWLHDAQKEHASVPAFARVSWMLAAVGAPAVLMEWAARAGLEEIDHARRCFALAAGYAGRAHEAQPMPDLLLAGLEVQGPALVCLALESLKDGCLLEDFNADVAEACARDCEDAAVRDVLHRIAREERSHAELSWAVLEWALARGQAAVRAAVERELRRLNVVPRPTAVPAALSEAVAQADAAGLRRHGRLPDTEWAALWETRQARTRRRAEAALAPGASSAQAA